MNLKISYKYLLLNILICFVTLLNNSIISFVIIYILFILFALKYGDYKFSFSKGLLITFIFTFLINMYQLELINILRLIQILIAFYFFPYKINIKNINTDLIASLLMYISIMTIANVLNMDFENKIKQFYPLDINFLGQVENDNVDSVSSLFLNRYATFYYNANILGQVVMFLIIIFLISKHNILKHKYDLFIILFSAIPLIVSGSRTSFVIIGFIIFTTVILNFKRIYKILSIFVALPFLFFYLLENTRLLQIVNTEEHMDSIGFKFKILFNYYEKLELDNLRFLQLFFGNLKTDLFVDNDIGYILYYSGIFGFIYFCFFIINLFKLINFKFKPYYIFILTMISSTIIFNFKFLIFFMIIISLLISSKESNKIHT